LRAAQLACWRPGGSHRLGPGGPAESVCGHGGLLLAGGAHVSCAAAWCHAPPRLGPLISRSLRWSVSDNSTADMLAGTHNSRTLFPSLFVLRRLIQAPCHTNKQARSFQAPPALTRLGLAGAPAVSVTSFHMNDRRAPAAPVNCGPDLFLRDISVQLAQVTWEHSERALRDTHFQFGRFAKIPSTHLMRLSRAGAGRARRKWHHEWRRQTPPAGPAWSSQDKQVADETRFIVWCFNCRKQQVSSCCTRGRLTMGIRFIWPLQMGTSERAEQRRASSSSSSSPPPSWHEWDYHFGTWAKIGTRADKHNGQDRRRT
jgi:hypothetical protein